MANPNDYWGARRTRNEGMYEYQAHGTDQRGRPLDNQYAGVEQSPRSPEISTPNTPIVGGPPASPYGFGRGSSPRNPSQEYTGHTGYAPPHENTLVSSFPRTPGLDYGPPLRLDERGYPQQERVPRELPPGHNYPDHRVYQPASGHPPRSSPPGGFSQYGEQYDEEEVAHYTTRPNAYTDSSAAPTPTPTHPYVAPPPPHPAHSLGSRYKKQLDPQGYFTRGKVFAVLWHEEAGDMPQGGTLSFTMTGWGVAVFSKVYRMVVVRWDRRSCVCLPIHTYGQQGYGKPGLTLQTHAPILLEGAAGPGPQPRQMIQDVLRIEPDNDKEMLDHRSLINFGAPCTVQHKCKVRPIGRLTPKSLELLLHYYRQCSMIEYYD